VHGQSPADGFGLELAPFTLCSFLFQQAFRFLQRGVGCRLGLRADGDDQVIRGGSFGFISQQPGTPSKPESSRATSIRLTESWYSECLISCLTGKVDLLGKGYVTLRERAFRDRRVSPLCYEMLRGEKRPSA